MSNMIFQFLRGNTSQLDAYTGPEGSLTYDVQKKALRLHDGITMGGFEIAGLADLMEEEDYMAIIRNADNVTEGTLATSRIDVPDLLSEAEFQYDSGINEWKVDMGTLA